VVRPLPFDRVDVTLQLGGRTLTCHQFLATPLGDRVTWLLERRLSFFLRGKPVDSRVALSALRGQTGSAPSR
jgi:hypothetical protein